MRVVGTNDPDGAIVDLGRITGQLTVAGK